MTTFNHIIYKTADTPDELEQIHRLNHEAFVTEIPQHEKREDNRLVDRFHKENTYMIAKDQHKVVGMIAVRGNRPFSLDTKLEDLDAYIPMNAAPCEIRLLVIKKEYRKGTVFFGLCEQLIEYCLEQGYTLALISGTTRQEKLYKRIGFRPFGPLVGTKRARYQPMYLSKENFETSKKGFKQLMDRRKQPFQHQFLPGPVPVSDKAAKAWHAPAVSHRSEYFRDMVSGVQQQLRKLTGAMHAIVAVGTGSHANDMVAAQLSMLNGKGLILVNGEFGERLIDHGKRCGLDFSLIQKPWNTPIFREDIAEILKNEDKIEWLWTVHCETSTGYLFDMNMLSELCDEHNVKLCVDACSSLGVVPVDLSRVYLASGVSGKGLASYPGLSIVFSYEQFQPSVLIPRYLDVGLYQQSGSAPFTHSSNSVAALQQALENRPQSPQPLADRIREMFYSVGMDVLGDDSYSPGIVTVALPANISVRKFGDCLKEKGIFISYESGYLLKQNWFQTALMGVQKEDSALNAAQEITREFKRFKRETGGTS
ncbi:2-aminoethylphosphonate--pyruvate transaminase [Lentibacillus sp. JNUCC-1]|uniref:GNAT family N-acetyltransferase n=1 Tax=Lentibacillus sp. JNUCC-1 TaxID=2654513 RepID=UPI0012E8D596|nr:GNAT family N-acetyltransferase [Lentibacillus sp. JNUCC-1]MUV36551.1 2-aminoethylphosphonate--pyruvate transaminase [Lentibacillus sp. JNUCC-1]